MIERLRNITKGLGTCLGILIKVSMATIQCLGKGIITTLVMPYYLMRSCVDESSICRTTQREYRSLNEIVVWVYVTSALIFTPFMIREPFLVFLGFSGFISLINALVIVVEPGVFNIMVDSLYLPVKRIFSINVKNSFGDTALHLAIWNENFRATEKLLKRTDVNLAETNGRGLTAIDLSMQIEDNKTDFLDLLQKTLIMNIASHPRQNIVHAALSQGNFCSELKKLIIEYEDILDYFIPPAITNNGVEFVRNFFIQYQKKKNKQSSNFEFDLSISNSSERKTISSSL